MCAYYNLDFYIRDEEKEKHTLTFNISFPYDHDTVYLAHGYPYTYTDLQVIEKNKSFFFCILMLKNSIIGIPNEAGKRPCENEIHEVTPVVSHAGWK